MDWAEKPRKACGFGLSTASPHSSPSSWVWGRNLLEWTLAIHVRWGRSENFRKINSDTKRWRQVPEHLWVSQLGTRSFSFYDPPFRSETLVFMTCVEGAWRVRDRRARGGHSQSALQRTLLRAWLWASFSEHPHSHPKCNPCLFCMVSNETIKHVCLFILTAGFIQRGITHLLIPHSGIVFAVGGDEGVKRITTHESKSGVGVVGIKIQQSWCSLNQLLRHLRKQ